jgi:hypothetical protein
MANDPRREHDQKHTQPPAAGGAESGSSPGEPAERGSGSAREAQERAALLTKEETDEEAEAWDQKKA